MNDEKKMLRLQLKKYETEPYILQFFQSNMTVCLIICVFCKSCQHECEPEIVLKIKTVQFNVWGTITSAEINDIWYESRVDFHGDEILASNIYTGSVYHPYLDKFQIGN